MLGAVHRLVVFRDDVHALEEHRLDRVLPRPQRQRVIAQRAEVRVQHQSRKAVPGDTCTFKARSSDTPESRAPQRRPATVYRERDGIVKRAEACGCARIGLAPHAASSGRRPNRRARTRRRGAGPPGRCRGRRPATYAIRPALRAPPAPARLEQRLRRDQVVLVAVDQQHRRPRLDLAGDRFGRRRRPAARTCRNSRRWPPARPRGAGPTCSAIMVPWLKPTSASADGGSLRRASSASRKRSSTGAGLVDAVPALVRIAEGERNHCRPDRRLAARLGRVRRDEGGVRQQALPGAADVDQVVAVGAVAVQEHHQPLAPVRSAARAAARRVHRPRRLRFASCVLACRWIRRLAFPAPARPRAASPRDSRPTTDARPPRATAAMSRRASPSPWRRAAVAGRTRCAPLPASARSPAGQASAWPRQNSR